MNYVKDQRLTESETWFYLKRRLSSWNPVADSLSLMHRVNTSTCFPSRWYSFGDVSKLELKMKINDENQLKCKKIVIRFKGSYLLNFTTMEPDAKGYDYFVITNPYKLKVISTKGLYLQVAFPQLEKRQQTRIAILILALPMLVTWFLFSLKKIIRKNNSNN